ncbi:MAG: DNA (cytosine-5-)-methyltransferase [Treponema sp.]|nr:DNA (cytosine-5-)-methyltransferase [Treponema sp.]
MTDDTAKTHKRQELIKKFSFEDSKLSEAENFFERKKIPFTSKADSSFTFVDLFAGIGGFRLAMQANGGHCVFSSEWDDAAKQTYYENYGEVPFGDITKVNPDNIPDFEVLAGGFPCQPFSSIGKREGFQHKTQGTLFFYIANIIKKKQPKAFLLENVMGLLTHDNGNTFETIIDTLKNELGYSVFYKVLNSADFKVPQERKRLYFVGFRNDLNISNFIFPEGNKNKIGIGQFVEKDAKGPSISKHLQESYIFKKNDGHPEIIDENSDFPVKTLCASYHKIQRITGTFVRGGETGLRLLTKNECKAIMGFPKIFECPVSRTQMYHQFGNSVAVPVVIEISKKITVTLSNKGAL